MRSGVIYLYTFPNGKVYVGQTRRDPQVRHREHFDSNLGPLNSAFWQAYQEQGTPEYKILETLQHEDVGGLVNLLNERETYYINFYKATDPNHGYNIKATGTASAHGSCKLCRLCDFFFYRSKKMIWPEYEEMKKKIGDKSPMTENERDLYNAYFVEDNPFYESKNKDEQFYEEWFEFADFKLDDDLRILAEEYVHENAAKLLEEYVDGDTIYQLDSAGNIIAKFESQAEAAAAMGAKTSANINNVVLGKQEKAYGYKWVKARDYRPSSQLSLFDKQ